MLFKKQAVHDAWTATDRTLDFKIVIKDKTYTALDITNLTFDSGAMNGAALTVGSTYQNTIKITFSHLIDGLELLDEVTPQIGIKLPDGTWDFTNLGVFVLDSEVVQDRNNNTTTLSASDRMCMLGGIYESKLTYPAPISDIAIEVANLSGVKINEADFARLPNTEINSFGSVTYRDAIGYVAQFAGGFATFDRDGLLDVRGLNDPNFRISPEQYQSKGLSKNESFYKIGGITCTVTTIIKDESGYETQETKTLQAGSSSGTQIALVNPSMTQILLDSLYQQLQDINFYPYSLNWFGDPTLEAGDWITVKDTAGNEFKTPNFLYSLTFGGGLSAISKADTTVTSSTNFVYKGHLVQDVENIRQHMNASGNVVSEGVDPPSNPKSGDIWFAKDGPDTIIKSWGIDSETGIGSWQEQVSTKPNEKLQTSVDNAAKDATDALDRSNTAVDTANQAVNTAGFAQDQVTQLKSDMADSVAQITTDANTAKTTAQTASTTATAALANAQTAMSDAATANNQANSAITQANTAIGNATDALNKVNNMSVGGVNLLLDTEFNNLPQYWTARAGKVTGTFNGHNIIYYDATKLTDGFIDVLQQPIYNPAADNRVLPNQWYTISFYVKGTGQMTSYVYGSFVDTSAGSYIDGVKLSYANNDGSRVWDLTDAWVRHVYTFKSRASLSNTEVQNVLFRAFKDNTVYITMPQLEAGTLVTDWSAAPEDVQIQIDNVNGELSQKVSQTTYNNLAGTVDTVSTLAKQNQSTIGTLATKTSVDTVNKTATTAQTLAQQNANELLNKASTNTVDTLTQRVTTAESTLSQTATKAELALTKTDVDKLGDSVASQALDIAATADALKLKADSSTVSDLAGTVAQNSAQLELTATKAELQVAQTNVDNLKKTVTSNTAGMTANANALKLKADSSTVSDLDGRVTSLSGQLDVQSDLISAKVTASDVTGMLGNYATQTWTQGKLDLTSSTLTSQISSVKDGLTTKYTQLQQTLNGVQVTANNAVTQAQLTLLSNQFTSVIGDLDNLVIGGDFEDQRNYIGQASPYWSSNAIVIDNGDKTTGNNPSATVLQIPGLLSGNNDVTSRNHIAVDQEEYKFSLKTRWLSANQLGQIIIFVFEYDADKKFIVQKVVARDTKPTGWHTVTGTYTPSDDKVRYIKFDVTYAGAQGTTPIYVDDIRMGLNVATQSQFTQLQSDVNLRVQKGDVINQINISPESILIAGQKVHITGQTTIDNAVIKDAMIATLSANKLTAGTIDAANINVINLNASNITTGVISGANLSINLNTGEILFTKGSIKSTNGKLNINVDDGTFSETNGYGDGIRFQDGALYLTANSWKYGSVPDYGVIQYDDEIFGDKQDSGIRIVGKDGIQIGSNDFGVLFPNGIINGTSGCGFFSSKSYAGLSTDKNGLVLLNGGVNYSNLLAYLQPQLRVGTGLENVGSRDSSPISTDKPGDSIYLAAKSIALVAQSGVTDWSDADFSLGTRTDGKGYARSLVTYNRTYSSGDHMIVTPYGALGRISSASKYKLNISKVNNITEQAHAFLAIEPKQWFDKAETEDVASGLTTGIKASDDDQGINPYYGFIAEDLYSAGLDRVVSYGTDGELEGIQYDRLTVYHHELIRELYRRINDLEAKAHLMEVAK